MPFGVADIHIPQSSCIYNSTLQSVNREGKKLWCISVTDVTGIVERKSPTHGMMITIAIIS